MNLISCHIFRCFEIKKYSFSHYVSFTKVNEFFRVLVSKNTYFLFLLEMVRVDSNTNQANKYTEILITTLKTCDFFLPFLETTVLGATVS